MLIIAGTKATIAPVLNTPLAWNKLVRYFHGRFVEMSRKEESNKRLKQMRHVAWILKRFPDTDENANHKKYPIVDVNAVKPWYISASSVSV